MPVQRVRVAVRAEAEACGVVRREAVPQRAVSSAVCSARDRGVQVQAGRGRAGAIQSQKFECVL